jgi:hypothetical protein
MAKNVVLGIAEIGAYMHKNNGKVTIKQYATTNKPIKPDAAVLTERIAHKRFELHEMEDDSVNNDVVYSKDVWSEQTDKGSLNKSSHSSERQVDDEDEEAPSPQNPLLTEKFREQQDQLNNHDNRMTSIQATTTALWVAILGVLVVSVCVVIALLQ